MTPVSFTVAIPTHDRREAVMMAVESCLRQTRAPLEVIVLADGCRDGTADAVRSLGDDRVEVMDLPKAAGYGYGHRNLALERARGEVITYLGDDDLYLPDHFERIGAVWDAGVADIVVAGAALIHEQDEMEPMTDEWAVSLARERMLGGKNRVPMAAVSIRVGAARRVGGWNPELPRRGDWDLWARLLIEEERSARCLEPTVLHFRASGRAQPYEDRVRQNRSWLDSIGDPAGLARLRVDYARLIGAREESLADRHRELKLDHRRLRREQRALRRRVVRAQTKLEKAGEALERASRSGPRGGGPGLVELAGALLRRRTSASAALEVASRRLDAARAELHEAETADLASESGRRARRGRL